MKKLTFAAAAAAFALPAVANAQAYVQIQGGLDSVSVDGESDEGFAYGIAAGYELPVSETVFAGVEVSLDDSTTKECETDVLVLGDEACLKTGRDISVVARLGTNVGANSKLYVLAGYTNARLKLTYEDGSIDESEGENGDGLRLGAGFQQDFGGNFFGKLEYRYSNYEADFSRHNVLAAVGVKF